MALVELSELLGTKMASIEFLVEYVQSLETDESSKMKKNISSQTNTGADGLEELRIDSDNDVSDSDDDDVGCKAQGDDKENK